MSESAGPFGPSTASQPTTRRSQVHFSSVYSKGPPRWEYKCGTENWRDSVIETTADQIVQAGPTFLYAANNVLGNLDPSSPTLCYAYYTGMPSMRWAMDWNMIRATPRVCEVQLQYLDPGNGMAAWKTKAGVQITKLPRHNASADTIKDFLTGPFATARSMYLHADMRVLTPHQHTFVHSGIDPDAAEFYRTWLRGLATFRGHVHILTIPVTDDGLSFPVSAWTSAQGASDVGQHEVLTALSVQPSPGSGSNLYPDFGLSVLQWSEAVPNHLDVSPASSSTAVDLAWDGNLLNSMVAGQITHAPHSQVEHWSQPVALQSSHVGSAQCAPLLATLREEQEPDEAVQQAMVDAPDELTVEPMPHSPAESVIVCAPTKPVEEECEPDRMGASTATGAEESGRQPRQNGRPKRKASRR